MPLAGGVAAFSGLQSPLNKVAGLGFAGAPTPAELDEVERRMAAAGAGVIVELANLADPPIGRELTARGYRLLGFENVLGLSLVGCGAPVAEGVAYDRDAGASGDTAIVSCDDDAQIDSWIKVTLVAFTTPDTQGVPSHENYDQAALEPLFRDLATGPRVRRFLACRAGVAAGGASLRIIDGIAQLSGAGTHPAHRRRGVQGALLAHRIKIAAEAGCELVIVTTLPGSKSQQNVQRRGFELLYTRALLARK